MNNSKENTLMTMDEEVLNTPVPDGLEFTLSSRKPNAETKEDQLEKAAMELISVKLNTDLDDIMLPEIVSMSCNKACSAILYELENHQFLQKTKKYRIHVLIHEVQ